MHQEKMDKSGGYRNRDYKGFYMLEFLCALPSTHVFSALVASKVPKYKIKHVLLGFWNYIRRSLCVQKNY